MVEAVVWDVGNIFARWQPEAYYDALIGPERRKRLFAEARLMEVNEALDLGARSRETVYAHAERHPDWAAEIRLWHDGWAETFREAVPGTEALFRAVKARGVPCYALSNFGAESFEIAKSLHPVLGEFDREFVSAHHGLAKPDPAFYAALEEGTGLSGEALIFVDDKAENLAPAEARGWKTHLFTDARGWGERLVKEGLLEPGDLR